MTAPSTPQPDDLAQNSPRFAMTDVGNAERFALAHAGQLLFVHGPNRWSVWDGQRWSEDRRGEVTRRAIDLVKSVDKSHESLHRIQSLLRLARSHETFAVDIEEFDSDPYRLNVSNGTVNLRSGEILPHDPDNRISLLAPVPFDPRAECPRWTTFLDQVLPSADVERYIKRLIGASLLGEVTAHVLPVLYGAGQNGKSTFLNIIDDLLGDYAWKSPQALLVSGARGQQSNLVAELRRRRFVSVCELDEGARLNEGQLKELTGGDRQVGRRLYQENENWAPTHSIWLATNHLPRVTGRDFGLWRRIKVLPFQAVQTPDPTLREKLQAELPGIMAWAVRGAMEYQDEGLVEPDGITTAVDEYRRQTDRVGPFIEECCELRPRTATPATELFQAYTGWCRDNGEQPVSQRAFGQWLGALGLVKDKQGRERRVAYFGIALRPSP